jgi:adenine-specific DNA-methyltransferase
MKDKIYKNENLDIVSEKVQLLKKHFPNCFTKDGALDFKKLESELHEVDIVKEGYSLNWLGKSYAKVIASLETETVISPDIEHNSREENKDSHNIYIKGDNLEVLKHLVNAYRGKITVIYIDPPYNTGTDEFVYEDDFDFTPAKLAELAKIDEEEAQRVLEFTERKSNSHSAWLTFMYPRLFIARELLGDDGVIFISIDDNEQANLKLLCDEIFGEENFVAQIIVQSNKRGQTYKDIAKTHEYVLAYTKNTDVVIQQLEKEVGDFDYSDNIGEFSIRELRNRNPKYGKFNRPNLYYPIYVNPSLEDKDGFCPVSLEKTEEYSVEVLPLNSQGNESCWRWGKKKFGLNVVKDKTLDSNLVAKLKTTGEYGIYEKYRKTTYKAKTIWFEDEIICENGDLWDETEVITEQGSLELANLGLSGLFDYPKPPYLIRKLLLLASKPDSIILDFFSGSGTTAQAVMELNAWDNGKRKYICVQKSEDLDAKLQSASSSKKAYFENLISFLDSINKPHLLSELGIERIKRAAEKIRNETNADIDYGFKVFDTKPITEENLNRMLKFSGTLVSDNTLLDQFGKETVLTTWMLEDGHPITTNYESVDLGNGYLGYKVNNTMYLLDGNFTIDGNLKTLIEKLENEESFVINKLVLFGYSFATQTIASVTDNMKHLRNGRKSADVHVEVRY